MNIYIYICIIVIQFSTHEKILCTGFRSRSAAALLFGNKTINAH